MQQISFEGMIKSPTYAKEIKFETAKCPDCSKNCKTKRGCLITQIQNEINKERGKLEPVSYIAVLMKLKNKSEFEISQAFSICRDYKNRGKPFSKCIFGMLKLK